MKSILTYDIKVICAICIFASCASHKQVTCPDYRKDRSMNYQAAYKHPGKIYRKIFAANPSKQKKKSDLICIKIDNPDEPYGRVIPEGMDQNYLPGLPVNQYLPDSENPHTDEIPVNRQEIERLPTSLYTADNTLREETHAKDRSKKELYTYGQLVSTAYADTLKPEKGRQIKVQDTDNKQRIKKVFIKGFFIGSIILASLVVLLLLCFFLWWLILKSEEAKK